MNIIVTEEMLSHAKRVGKARQDFHDNLGTGDYHGYGLVAPREVGVRLHTQGALSEIIIADYFGLLDTWVEVAEDFKALPGDVGLIQVRSTFHATGRLLLHDEDKDESPYVLVRFPEPYTADIAGWITGKLGKRRKWWPGPNANRPCYAIPSEHLFEIQELSIK